MFGFGTKADQKKLEATMLSINTILNGIYKNKSSDEYKMKGDITKSPMYDSIEKMVADLSTLRGYPSTNVKDMKNLFKTLHLPIFKSMAKEFIMEPNDKNTVFTSMFTIGYRLLVGELSRIFAATEATSKGIVYKPTKISKNEDATKMIRLFNDQLEDRLNKYIQDLHKKPEAVTPINEAFLLEMFAQEGHGFREVKELKPSEKISDKEKHRTDFLEIKPESGMSSDDVESYWKDEFKRASEDEKSKDRNKRVSFNSEEVELGDNADSIVSNDSSDGEATDTDTSNSDDTVQEGLGAMVIGGITKATAGVTAFASGLGTVVACVAAVAGLVKIISSLVKGINPIAEINFLFMNSYEKKIQKLSNISKMYLETKKAYEEYMKIPEAKRDKKVESKYIKNMNSYNAAMQKLSAEVEHFNQRAKKESEDAVNEMERKMPSGKVDTNPKTPANQETDDDIQF